MYTTPLKNLLCDATYWDSSYLFAPENQDADYVCNPDDPQEPETMSVQYLDCLCGTNGWDNPPGSGEEEPLEAALLALCRAEENPPDACYWINEPNEDGSGGLPSVFGTNDIGGNSGFLREDSTVVVVIVGDEGDSSNRIPAQSEDPSSYLDAFEQFERPIKFVTFGPNIIPDDDGVGYSMPCNNGGATDYAALRLKTMADETGGFYRPLEVSGESGDCELANFGVHLEELGDLLNNLDTSFQLATIPDVTTIQVYVDGETIEPAEVLEENPDGTPTLFGPGWSYTSADNAVTFWGDPIINPRKLDEGCCIPDYNSDVRIYYRPLSGKPRELPFNY